MRIMLAAALAALPLGAPAETVLAAYEAPGMDRSLRPVARPDGVRAQAVGMEAWIAAFRPRALAAGIRPEVFDRALAGVTPDPEVVRRDRSQSEFTKTIWDYLSTAVSEARVANGRRALARHAATLGAVEARYGVDKHVVAAIWGLESAYGGFRGGDSTIRSLATLAHDGRRGDFFEAELLAALRILQEGEVTPQAMRGSWAGAMGHTQFMPSSFLEHAVDATGDGRRDIWGDDPADALASAAAYLANHGWTPGQPWGVEVRLPEGFDHMEARRDLVRLPSEWAAMGVTGARGPVADHGPASVLLPAGHRGAAFLVFGNFEVLEAYNTADAYVIGVGHLADRLRGGPPLAGDWPRADRALTFAERTELQRRLTAAGFDTVKVDGRIGPLTVDAVRRYQASMGLVPDGYANLALLQRLR